MPVSFEKLIIGEKYERPYLSDLWGYKGFQAISRGVVTPAGTNFIVLFVTKQKQSALTQYNDYLNGDLLHWEGEEKHSSDSRIVNAKTANEEIHLFYRDIHHTPFTYYGQVLLKTHQIHTTSPSQFIFSLINDERRPDIFEDIETHQREFKALEQTEKEAVVKSRIGQGVFRERVIELWGSCAVTDLANTSMLRASHIKPWRDSSNQERLDPMNGLLLQPNLDYLFDLGFITFDGQGVIMFSPTLSSDDIQKLGLTPSTRLRKLPDQLGHYLDYHRTSVFKRD